MSAAMFIFFAMLISAILGFLIAWILRKAGLDTWRGQYETKASEYSTLESKYKNTSKLISDFEGKNKTLVSSNSNLKTDVETWQSKYRECKSQLDSKAGLSSQLDDYKKRFGDLDERYRGQEAIIRDLEEGLKGMEAEKSALSKKLNEKGEQKSETKSAPVVKAQSEGPSERDMKDLEHKLTTLRQRNDKLELEFNELNKNLDSMSKVKSDLEINLEKANAEVNTLKTKVKEGDKSSEIESMQAKVDTMQLKHDEAVKNYNGLQMTNGDLLKQIATIKAASSGATVSDEFKAKFDKCQEEVAGLKKKLEEASAKAVEVAKPAEPVKAAEPAKPMDKNQETLMRIKEKASKIDFGRIGTAEQSDRDDLKLIKGIGPFIEEKLNALGIYKFKQIANFTGEDDDLVNDAIEFFPGRVKRDEWSKQAKDLMNG